MAPSSKIEMQRSIDNSGSQTHHAPLHEAVAKFGQLAVDQQTNWVIDMVLKRLEGRYSTRSSVKVTGTKVFPDGSVIYPHRPPPEELQESLDLSPHTCALPCCLGFNRLMKSGEPCMSIELESDLRGTAKFRRPSATLAAVRMSPISGELNLRGRGETGCFRFHIACGEIVLSRSKYTKTPTSAQLPTASLPMGDYTNLICVEPYPTKPPGYEYQLEPPEIYSIFKWIAVVQAEKGAVGVEDQDFWWKDGGLAAYSSQEQADFVGRWHGTSVELAAEQVKGHLLSTVLKRVKVSKKQALAHKIAQWNKKSQPKAAGVNERTKMDVARKNKEAGSPEQSITSEASEGSQGSVQEEIEVSLDDSKPTIREFRWHLGQPEPHRRRQYFSEDEEPSMEGASPEEYYQGDSEIEDSLSETSSFHAAHLPPFWDDYLTKGRNAFRHATESVPGSTEVSTLEDESIEATPSEGEESSTGSLRLVTPMVRFLLPDSEDTCSRPPDSSIQEVSLETDDTTSEDGESLDSWSDPEETLATIGDNVGLAIRLF